MTENVHQALGGLEGNEYDMQSVRCHPAAEIALTTGNLQLHG